jgi:hypothetical protein
MSSKQLLEQYFGIDYELPTIQNRHTRLWAYFLNYTNNIKS